MKKTKKFIKSNIKTVIAFIIGLVLAGGSAAVVYAISATSITYTDTNNIGATTVQGAIDKLGERASTWINPSTYPLKMNIVGTIWATPAGMCIKRNNISYCFGTNNFDYEKDHIQQVFSDVGCANWGNYVDCNASDFDCSVLYDGYVDCKDNSVSGNPGCSVDSAGAVYCY